jgi:hypothetical protein
MSNIKKTECIKLFKSNEPSSIHPLLNLIINRSNNPKLNESNNNIDLCHILPQIANNMMFFMMKPSSLKNDESQLNMQISEIKSDVIKDGKQNEVCDNPFTNFMLPINGNNFLEIVFNITTINQLYEWISNFDVNIRSKNIVELVLDLFWINNYNKIDDELDMFIKLNQEIIKIMFNKNVSHEIVIKIINRLVRNNYGKKIKYLDKIKKYLMKYI